MTGRDAAAFLDRLCANRVPRRRGGVVLAHMLGEPGGIECEATISRLGDERFFVLSGATAELHDLDWMSWHIGDDEEVEIANRTADYACLVLTGPRARDVLGALTDADLGNEAFPWMSAREIEAAGVVPVRALRVSYVGELGWELHHPMEGMETLYDALMEAGAAHGIVNFGLYAMNAMRMEKGYKGWGAELTTEVTPVEGRARALREARQGLHRRRRRQGPAGARRRNPPRPTARWRPKTPTRWATSRCSTGSASSASPPAGPTAPRCAARSPSPTWRARTLRPGTTFDIGILGERRAATVQAEPLYDPRNERLRA